MGSAACIEVGEQSENLMLRRVFKKVIHLSSVFSSPKNTEYVGNCWI